MRIGIVSFFFCLSSFLGAAETSFQSRLEKARSGDYIVTEANKMITVLTIRFLTPSSVVFEEISIPSQKLKNYPSSWSEWVKNRAPGHTSWAMVEIDLDNHQPLECYSFSRAAWIGISQQESLLSTLLQLPLKLVPLDKVRRIGPPPLDGEPDRRQVWMPPLSVEGQKIEQAKFDIYETQWPKDSSELSGKTVTLYFDQEGRFPLPYWIQVETTHVTATMRVIDSGQNLASPYTSLPRRVPEFIGTPQWTNKGTLRLSLKSPKYYKNFELFAIDITTKEKQIFPIACSIAKGQGEMLNIEIEKTELSEVFEPGHRYTWLLVPAGYSEFYTESTLPFNWNPH